MTLADWLAVSEVVRNLGLVAAGFVALVFAGFRVRAANRQAEAATREAALARRGHVADLFDRAVEQPGSDTFEVRMGAIYTLGQISRDFPDLTGVVGGLLSAYLRENRVDYAGPNLAPDVAEIVAIVREHGSRRR
ncbi:MAG: hypothetical protein KDG89_09145 [Geminicoccaceae bacterium]|nr:hypothetical protein [Geminicoccaceae bacterium]